MTMQRKKKLTQKHDIAKEERRALRNHKIKKENADKKTWQKRHKDVTTHMKKRMTRRLSDGIIMALVKVLSGPRFIYI
jgi:hypothetical protein